MRPGGVELFVHPTDLFLGHTPHPPHHMPFPLSSPTTPTRLACTHGPPAGHGHGSGRRPRRAGAAGGSLPRQREQRRQRGAAGRPRRCAAHGLGPSFPPAARARVAQRSAATGLAWLAAALSRPVAHGLSWRPLPCQGPPLPPACRLPGPRCLTPRRAARRRAATASAISGTVAQAAGLPRTQPAVVWRRSKVDGRTGLEVALCPAAWPALSEAGCWRGAGRAHA